MAKTFKKLKGNNEFPYLDRAHPYEQYQNTYPYEGSPDSDGIKYSIRKIGLCTVRWTQESTDRPYWPTIINHGDDHYGAKERDDWFDKKCKTNWSTADDSSILSFLPKQTINIAIPYEESLYYNYMMIRGIREFETGDIWQEDRRETRYYYFIEDSRPLNQSVTEFTIVLDAWTNYMMFDTITDNVKPPDEGLEPSDRDYLTRPVRISRVMLEQGHAPVTLSTDKTQLLDPSKMEYLSAPEPDAPSQDDGTVASGSFTPFGIGPDYLALVLSGGLHDIYDIFKTQAGPARYQHIQARALTLGDDYDGLTPLVDVDDGEIAGQIGPHTTPPIAQGSWSGGPFGEPAGYTGGTADTPEDVGYSCIAIMKDNAEGLFAHFNARPQLWNRVQAAFVLPESVLFPNGDQDKITHKITTGSIKDTTIYWVPESVDSIVASIKPDKDDFHLPDRYADLRKLYTFPYSWLEVTDNQGASATIKVEDVYSAKIDKVDGDVSVTDEDRKAGGMKIRERVSLIYPYLKSSIFLQGVKGSGHSEFRFRQMAKQDGTILPPDSTWEALSEWDIPTYGLWADAGSVKAASTSDSYHAQTQSALLGYNTARQNANTSYTNALMGAQLSYDNTNRSLDTNYDNTKRSIQTSYDNGVIGLNTSRDNATASTNTGYDNTIRATDTGNTIAHRSADTGLANAERSVDTSRKNAQINADTTTNNASSSASTGKTNATNSASTAKTNATNSASTAISTTEAANKTSLRNTDESIATSESTNARANLKINTDTANAITLMKDVGDIGGDLTNESLKANMETTVALNTLDNISGIVSSAISGAGSVASATSPQGLGHAAINGATSTLSTGLSNFTSGISMYTIISRNKVLAQAGMNSNYQRWKATSSQALASTNNDIKAKQDILERSNNLTADVAKRNADTSNANTKKSADTGLSNAKRAADTGLDNSIRSIDTDLGNTARSVDSGLRQNKNANDTAITNATASAATSTANADDSAATSKTNAGASKDTSIGNIDRSYDNGLTQLKASKNTGDTNNTNSTRTGKTNATDSYDYSHGTAYNGWTYGRGNQQKQLGIAWQNYASGITDARRGPQMQVSAASGDASPDILKTRGIQVRFMRQKDDVISRCGDEFLLHGYHLGRVIEGDGIEREIDNPNFDHTLYPYMSKYVYVKGEPTIYPDDERNKNAYGLHVQAPAFAVDEIRDLYREGVTVWTDPDAIGGDIYDNVPVLEAK